MSAGSGQAPSEVYRRGAAEFLGVVRGLGEEQAGTPVPACPAWTVHDLLAHLAGSSTDLVTGNVEGVTTVPWSARQVEDRRGRSTAELVGEWERNLEPVALLCDTVEGPNPAWDVAVHLADLREALGLPPGPPENGWGAVLPQAAALVAQRAGTASVAEDGPDPGTTTWHVATAYGLWRALFSRLDRPRLEREVLRGDVDALAAAAFFSR